MAKLLASFTVLDNLYKNGLLRVITGQEDGTTGNVGTINDPANTDVSFDGSIPDPVIFSFPPAAADTGITARALLAKINSTGGGASTCLYNSLVSPAAADDGWTSVAKDITFTVSDSDLTPVATNPHGVAWVGDYVYIIDYESPKVYWFKKNALDNLSVDAHFPPASLDLSSHFPDISSPYGARGQAIIALQYTNPDTKAVTNYLYALYMVNNNANPSDFQNGFLIRLKVTDSATGDIDYVDRALLGLNPQEIVPVTGTDGTVTLLIPEIGGGQRAQSTNGDVSDIQAVEAFVDPDALEANILVKGDLFNTWPATAYDIHAIAASAVPGDDSTVYILTADYTEDYIGADWKLYKTTVSGLLGAGEANISNAGFSIADQDNSEDGTFGYFWDILYENAGGAGDRLWFLMGSPILVTLAGNYVPPPQTGTDNRFFDRGTGPGQIGGSNVNSFDLTIETSRQSLAGVSCKRGFRGGNTVKAAARAAKAAKAGTPEEKGK